ncbi:MAG: sigma-70 family RNA polymerase sigma factor [candidate division KSB1 bacterium]|nr:sigma-70 family RNA polymerase sigma factor [candidate division KSB1 bacterium]MDZ7385200.1 sigma-70 family RNA polymerase sigma factor [candidate division KSB1 bacterium]
MSEELFLRLLDEDDCQAWQFFVTTYSRFVLRIVGHFVTDYDDKMDAFLFVCQGLAANRLKRLKGFRKDPDVPCKFTTWLVPVVRNLVIDWFRHKRGRKRLSKAVAALPPPAQWVFRYCFQLGYAPAEAFELIRQRHAPTVRFDEVRAAIGQIREALGGSRVWEVLQASQRGAPMLPAESGVGEEERAGVELTDGQPPPDAQADREQLRAVLHRLIEELPPQEKLLLRLRFDEGLSPAEIAGLLRYPHVRVVYQGIRQAVHHLRLRLRKEGWKSDDFAALTQETPP